MANWPVFHYGKVKTDIKERDDEHYLTQTTYFLWDQTMTSWRKLFGTSTTFVDQRTIGHLLFAAAVADFPDDALHHASTFTGSFLIVSKS